MDKYRKISLARVFVFVAYIVAAIGLPLYGFIFLANYLLANPIIIPNYPILMGIFLTASISGYLLMFILWALFALGLFGYATQEV
jgi:hypothetical protein